MSYRPSTYRVFIELQGPESEEAANEIVDAISRRLKFVLNKYLVAASETYVVDIDNGSFSGERENDE